MSQDFDFLGDEDKQAEQKAHAIEFAKLYVAAFVHNPAGKKLLDHWTSTLMRERLGPNNTPGEYAWAESRRAFVQNIQQQIDFVQQSGQ